MRAIHTTLVVVLVALTLASSNLVESSREICIEGPDNLRTNVTIGVKSTVLDIKSKLFVELTIPIEQQILLLNGTQLEDTKTVLECKLWRFPVLKLKVDDRDKLIRLSIQCDGKVLSPVEVSARDTIRRIKSIIFFSLGLYPRILIHPSGHFGNEVTLSGDKTLSDEGLSGDEITGTLHLDCTVNKPNSFLMPVKCLDGNTYRIEVDPFDTIELIKLKLEFESGIAAKKQKLLIDGAEEDIKLTNDKTLAHYKIWNYAGLKLITRPKIKLSVYCKPSVNITIEVEADEPIENIRSILAKELGIPNEVQGLTSNDRIMQDGSRLSEYRHATDIVLIPGERTILESLSIWHGRHKISLRAGYSLTIKEVKLWIEANHQIPANRQRLFLNDLELLNGKTLRDYKLYKETSLKLVVADDPSLKIKFRVKNLLGQEVSFDLSVNENIGNLKKLIAESPLKIPTHKQRLFFLGHELADDNTLRQCKISKDCLVQVASYGNRDLDTALDEDDDDGDAN